MKRLLPNIYYFELKSNEYPGLYFWKHKDGKRIATLTCPICKIQHNNFALMCNGHYVSGSVCNIPPHPMPKELDCTVLWNTQDSVYLPKEKWQQEIDRQLMALVKIYLKNDIDPANQHKFNLFLFSKDMLDGRFQIATMMTTAFANKSLKLTKSILDRFNKMKAFL